MWVILNDAMFSIVEDRTDNTQLVVRARFEGDIEKVFPSFKDNVKVSEDSDYRFRIFVDRERVAEIMASEVRRIDYDNFKNSVYTSWRRNIYTKIWTVLFNAQEEMYPREKGYGWWTNYRQSYESSLNTTNTGKD